MPKGLRRTSSKERKRIGRSVVRRYGVADPVGPFNVDGTPYVVFCFHCDLWLNRETFTLDHIIPVALGGDNSVYNFVPSCQPCNSKRGCEPLGNEAEMRLVRQSA